MEVSVNVGYFGPHISSEKSLIKELDEIGISCIWTAEAYGYDAVTPLSYFCLLYTSPSPRDATLSRMPSSA